MDTHGLKFSLGVMMVSVYGTQLKSCFVLETRFQL